MFTEEKIIEKIKELKNTSPRAGFKNRMENLVIPVFLKQNKKRTLFLLSPRFLAPFLLAFFFTLTTLTSVAADSQPGSIFFPFKNTAVKIQSAFIKNSPTPTMTPSPSPTGAPSLTPTPTVTKIPVKPTVKLTVKPTLTLLPSKALILPPIESGKLSPTPTPLSLLNIDVQLPKTGIHLSL